MFTPREIAHVTVQVGKRKAALPPQKALVMGILAGWFIGLVCVGANAASAMAGSAGSGKLISAMIFPAGLCMVVLAGAELFTGNNLMVMALLERQIRLSHMLRNWALVYVGNVIGCISLAFLVSVSGELSLFDQAVAVTTIGGAAYKSAMPPLGALLLAIPCNVLVCLSTWMSFASKDVAGKAIAIYFPVLLFVISGFEHSIANVYFAASGLFAVQNPAYAVAAAAQGVDISALRWDAFLGNNLLPVTLGNLIGGALLTGCVLWYVYLYREPRQEGM